MAKKDNAGNTPHLNPDDPTDAKILESLLKIQDQLGENGSVKDLLAGIKEVGESIVQGTTSALRELSDDPTKPVITEGKKQAEDKPSDTSSESQRRTGQGQDPFASLFSPITASASGGIQSLLTSCPQPTQQQPQQQAQTPTGTQQQPQQSSTAIQATPPQPPKPGTPQQTTVNNAANLQNYFGGVTVSNQQMLAGQGGLQFPQTPGQVSQQPGQPLPYPTQQTEDPSFTHAFRDVSKGLQGAFDDFRSPQNLIRKGRKLRYPDDKETPPADVAGRMFEGIGEATQGIQRQTQKNNLGGIGDLVGSAGTVAGAIPGIGPVIEGFTTLGKTMIDAIDGLRNFGEGLHDANMQFAQFSGAMMGVMAEKKVAEIGLSAERGDRLAPSAEILAEGLQELQEGIAPFEDFFREFMNEGIGPVLKTIGGLLKEIATLLGMKDKKDNKNEYNDTAEVLEMLTGQRRPLQNYGRPARFRDTDYSGSGGDF